MRSSILRVGWLRMERRLVVLLRWRGRRIVDLDVSNRVPLHAVAIQTVTGRRKVDWGTNKYMRNV